MIDSFINAVFLYDDRIAFAFNYKDGTKTVTLEELENSALGSDFDITRCTTTKSVYPLGIQLLALFVQVTGVEGERSERGARSRSERRAKQSGGLF